MAQEVKQTVRAAQDWRRRMSEARALLKELKVGQTEVIRHVVTLQPDIDSLTLMIRWRNAWAGNAADVEFTLLVEQAAQHFKNAGKEKNKRSPTRRMKPPLHA